MALYGTTQTGEEIKKFIIINGKSRVEIIEFGARITHWYYAKDKNTVTDIVTGYDTLSEYEKDPYYKGGICGRTTGRIRGAKFTLENTEYQLSVNYPPHQVHGGKTDFTKKIWAGEQLSPSLVRLTMVSADGDEGYPGELTTAVHYELTRDDALVIGYTAHVTGHATPVNLTNHAFFNLAGHDHGLIDDHTIRINADHHLALDKYYVPEDDKLHPVLGTKYDLRNDSSLAQTGLCGHYITGEENSRHSDLNREAARFACKASNLQLRLYTTAPGLEFYDAEFLRDGTRAKGGGTYGRRSCFCCVAHGYPDTMHQPGYPSMVYNPGETYTQITAHWLSTLEQEKKRADFLDQSEVIKIITAVTK